MKYLWTEDTGAELHFWQLIMNGLLSFAYTTMESVSGSYIPNR